LNIELAAEPPTSEQRSITGVVLDAAGRPERGAWVGIRRGGSFGVLVFFADREPGSAITGEDGRFEVQVFGRGDDQDPVMVVARAGGSFGAVQGVKVGAEVTVQLQPAATVVSHAIGFAGGSYEALVEPHELAGPTESSSWVQFQGDQFTLTDLAPVPSVLRVRQGGTQPPSSWRWRPARRRRWRCASRPRSPSPAGWWIAQRVSRWPRHG